MIFFLILHNCISFAKHQNESATGIHVYRLIFKVYLSLAQLVKNLPARQETRVQFLCWEDPLEKELATHSSILAWEIPWTEKPGRIQSMG